MRSTTSVPTAATGPQARFALRTTILGTCGGLLEMRGVRHRPPQCLHRVGAVRGEVVPRDGLVGAVRFPEVAALGVRVEGKMVDPAVGGGQEDGLSDGGPWTADRRYPLYSAVCGPRPLPTAVGTPSRALLNAANHTSRVTIHPSRLTTHGPRFQRYGGRLPRKIEMNSRVRTGHACCRSGRCGRRCGQWRGSRTDGCG